MLLPGEHRLRISQSGQRGGLAQLNAVILGSGSGVVIGAVLCLPNPGISPLLDQRIGYMLGHGECPLSFSMYRYLSILILVRPIFQSFL
ncbi:hypothetical protein D3C80_1842270 [compost metagenome]